MGSQDHNLESSEEPDLTETITGLYSVACALLIYTYTLNTHIILVKDLYYFYGHIYSYYICHTDS